MKLELIAVIVVTMVTVDCRSLNRKPRESKDYSGDYTNEGLIPVANGPQDGVEVVEIDSVPEGQQHDVMTIDVDVDDNGKVSQRFRQAGDDSSAGVPTAGEVTVLDPNQGSTDSPGMSSSDTGSSEDPPSESPSPDGPGDSSSEGPDFSLPDPPSRPPGPMSTAVPVTPEPSTDGQADVGNFIGLGLTCLLVALAILVSFCMICKSEPAASQPANSAPAPAQSPPPPAAPEAAPASPPSESSPPTPEAAPAGGASPPEAAPANAEPPSDSSSSGSGGNSPPGSAPAPDTPPPSAPADGAAPTSVDLSPGSGSVVSPVSNDPSPSPAAS